MKMTCECWFRMAVQLSLILLGTCSDRYSFRRDSSGINNLASKPPPQVKLNTQNSRQVVIDNGIVSLNLSKPEGYIIGIYTGINNVLDPENDAEDRGYFDVVWNQPGKRLKFERGGRPQPANNAYVGLALPGDVGSWQKESKGYQFWTQTDRDGHFVIKYIVPGDYNLIHGTKFSVIVANENMVEVSFLRTWTASMEGSSVPINIDQRYILRRGDSGFYSYVVFNRPPGLPAVQVVQIRIVFKLDKTRFHYMAISDSRQRNMPSMEDRERGERLAYPEAVLLTHPSNQQFKDEVDDKYQYSSENKDNSVHGWITEDNLAPEGFWMITPSNEFRNAGPIKQDLTSHVGPITLSMFVSNHYAGKEVIMAFDEGETYKKVFGPIFVYLNSVPTRAQFRSLWSDAVEQLSKEVGKWPYDFVGIKDFLPPNQRGTVSGRLQVQDGGGRPQPANNAYVGLALPGDVGSWQKESKGYQFWTQTNRDGHFVIKNIVPGDYNLYAWVPGFIGDYRYTTKIIIKPGDNINLGALVYNPPRNGPTLWEIGIPDRSAAEFYVPDPNPKLVNMLYVNNTRNKFRQYGLWERYTELYPKHDLIYTVGAAEYHKDWFFAQVTRSTTNKAYLPTTWQIQFELQNMIQRGNYTLQLALASATDSRLEVRFNDPKAKLPHFSTGKIGDDNAIARHGIHGLYRMYTIVVGNNLIKGKNIIYLTQSKVIGPFGGIMYDYIRFESPPTKVT